MIIGAVWSAFWLILTRSIFRLIWGFDFLSDKQWKVVAEFWNENGTIRGFSDYMLFICLLCALWLWIKVWKKLHKVNYLALILRPFEYMNKKQIEKYQANTKRVVIKNMVVGEKITVNDLIEERIKAENKESGIKEAENLRSDISKKIIERKEK